MNPRRHSPLTDNTSSHQARRLQYKSPAVRHVTPVSLYRMSVCKVMLSESSYCPACNSFFHAPDECPKTLPTYQQVSNVLVGQYAHIGVTDPQTRALLISNDEVALEPRLRSILAKGIGHEGRRCDTHRKMQLQLLSKAQSGRNTGVSIVLDVFDDSCFVTRTLLSICSTCKLRRASKRQRCHRCWTCVGARRCLRGLLVPLCAI